MPDRSSKRPGDLNQLAKLMVDIAAGAVADKRVQFAGKDPAAVSLGKRGGLKGGVARALKLSPTERSEIAKKAAQSRWGSNRGKTEDR